jgi:Mg-chelatase subunit ChlD
MLGSASSNPTRSLRRWPAGLVAIVSACWLLTGLSPLALATSHLERPIAASESTPLLAREIASSGRVNPQSDDAAPAAPLNLLARAPQDERDLIERLRNSQSWVRRAFAAERLARFDCPPSRDYLLLLLKDDSWRVRAFAVLALARRGVPLPESSFADEPEQRVIRTALRCRYAVPRRPLTALIRRLAESPRLDDKTMALELLMAGGLADENGKPEPGLGVDPIETLGEVILRMDRIEAGGLSLRLATITKGHDSGRNYKWREWFRKNKRAPGLDGAHVVAEDPAARERGTVAGMPLRRLLDLESHMKDLSGKAIELAIAIDCTASMSGELAECQSGIDSLMLFAQDVAKSARIGVVGYRDEKDDWETKGWDLTASLDEARDHLWQLSAEGGGDRPESVLPALRLAYGKMTWDPAAVKSVILVGDAPPQLGTGDRCVELAERAFAKEKRREEAAKREKKTADPRAPSTSTPDSGDPNAKGEPRGIRTYTIAPHARPEEEAEPPAGEFGRPAIAPMTRPEKKPVSPWRQKLKPGEVEYWKEIAEAGGGRSVGLPRDASLMAEIAGLTLGETYKAEFESFFASWLALCR